MAKYVYEGSGPCRVGATQVEKGTIVESDTNPGKNFRLLPEVEPPATVRPSKKGAQEAGESS